MAYIKGLTYAEQKTLWACNDKIARENAGRYAHMNLREALTPAILPMTASSMLHVGTILEVTRFYVRCSGGESQDGRKHTWNG